jgi:hypothetical protein
VRRCGVCIWTDGVGVILVGGPLGFVVSLVWIGFGRDWTSFDALYSDEVDLVSFVARETIARETIRSFVFSSFFRCELLCTLWISPVEIHWMSSGLFPLLPCLSYSHN